MHARLALFLIALLVSLPGRADESAPRPPPPPSPGIALPPFASVREPYHSYHPPAPATDWRGANAAVGALGGHGGQLATPIPPRNGIAVPPAPEAGR